MNYLVSIYARFFTIHRVVTANSKAEALAMVGTEGAICMMVEEVTEGE